MEQHELRCPVIARISECQLYCRSLIGGFPPLNNHTVMSRCAKEVMHHLRTKHPLLSAVDEGDVERGGDQCLRPHEQEAAECARLEAWEERWIDHWSGKEENSRLSECVCGWWYSAFTADALAAAFFVYCTGVYIVIFALMDTLCWICIIYEFLCSVRSLT